MTRQELRWIAHLWRPYWWFGALILAASLVSTLILISLPLILKQAFDGLKAGLTKETLVSVVLLYLGLGTLSWIFLTGLIFMRGTMNHRFESAARSRAYAHLVRHSAAFFQRLRTGDLVTRLTDDVSEKLSWFICSGIFRAFAALAVVVFAVVMMARLDPLLTLFTAGPLPLLVFLFISTGTVLEQRFEAVQRRLSDLNGALEACFSGVRVVKAYGREAAEERSFGRFASECRRTEIEAARSRTMIDLLFGHVWQLGVVVVLLAGGIGVMRGRLTLGTFVAFDAYVLMLIFPMFDIGTLFVRGRQSSVSIGRLLELETTPPEIQEEAARAILAPPAPTGAWAGPADVASGSASAVIRDRRIAAAGAAIEADLAPADAAAQAGIRPGRRSGEQSGTVGESAARAGTTMGGRSARGAEITAGSETTAGAEIPAGAEITAGSETTAGAEGSAGVETAVGPQRSSVSQRASQAAAAPLRGHLRFDAIAYAYGRSTYMAGPGVAGHTRASSAPDLPAPPEAGFFPSPLGDAREGPGAEDFASCEGSEPQAGAQAAASLGGTSGSGGVCLQGISFEVRPGEIVAVVGPVGSGKSTLLRLVPRLIDPTGGRVLLDGTDLRHIPLGVLRRAVGYAPQEAILFSGTIRSNISFGREGIGDDQVKAASDVARLARDLAQLPEGLDTRVGVRGVTLSGGQKQRVALARALAGQPRILVLDDVTAALDAETETSLWEELQRVLPTLATIVVTHRTATLERADRILVLEGGRLVEQGTHAELSATGRIYRSLYRRHVLEERVGTDGGE